MGQGTKETWPWTTSLWPAVTARGSASTQGKGDDFMNINSLFMHVYIPSFSCTYVYQKRNVLSKQLKLNTSTRTMNVHNNIYYSNLIFCDFFVASITIKMSWYYLYCCAIFSIIIASAISLLYVILFFDCNTFLGWFVLILNLCSRIEYTWGQDRPPLPSPTQSV